MANRSTFVGLDVHKESIAVALAEGGRFGEVRAYGTLGASSKLWLPETRHVVWR